MLSRRRLLKETACGFGYLALAGLCAEQAAAAGGNPLAPRAGHFKPRAKRVIFLFMQGGPSHVDTFDYKPRLATDDGKPAPPQGQASGNSKQTWRKSPFKFAQHGDGGVWMSELFPHLAERADDLCLLNGMHTDQPIHAAASVLLHTGSSQFVRPSVGAWTLYGLGTENQELPGFITLNPATRVGGAQNYGSAFLPASFQGTRIGGEGERIATAQVAHISTNRMSTAEQRRRLDLIQSMNHRRLEADVANNELEGVIESYELAFRMQGAMPRLMDLAGETQTTLEQYGIGKGRPTDEFGRACLLARRFAESGVRFIEITHSDWDQHSDLVKLHTQNARAVDKPIAALLSDLEARGLLDDTLVVWGGEFGRTPAAALRAGDGRDKNATGYTMWLAGGGVQGGRTYGATDEHGVHAVDNKTHIHDLHATILHLLGLDHTKLTYRYSGRDFRLTDVHGRVLSEIIS